MPMQRVHWKQLAISQKVFRMTSLTICNLDSDLMARLRVRAAQHRRSLKEEVRCILREALRVDAVGTTGAPLVADIRALVRPFGGIELELPPREPMGEPPDFGLK